MKKYLFLFLMAMPLLFASCSSDDDDDDSAYPMEELYGKWKVTELKVNETWYDVTKYPYTRFGMSITFYEDGTFYGSGYLGNGKGTYKVSGNTITTYVDGELYVTYTINSLTENTADLTLNMEGQELRMRAKKVK